MDKVKLILTGLKKYHFWVLIVVVVVVGLVMWATATADLAGRYEKREGELDGHFSAVRTIVSEPAPPNQGVVDAIQHVHQDLKEKVLQAWEILYKEQKEKNPWSPVLGEDFLIVVNSLGPDDEIPVQYRELYQNFIRDHFPRLLEIIDVRRPAEPKDDGTAEGAKMMPEGTRHPGHMGSGRMGTDVEMIGKVEWNDQDLERIEAWFDWQRRPSTLRVRLAQEDLWVYEALLRIVKNTNEGATGYYNGAVKRIEALEIGQDVSQKRASSRPLIKSTGSQNTRRGGQPMGAPGDMMGEGMMSEAVDPQGMGPPAVEPGARPGRSGADGKSSDQRLAQRLMEGRYVDDSGNPLEAAAKHPYAEFKMMPIRMLLVMDQRKLPRLLVECANSSMPVEVRQVGISPGEGARIDFSRIAAQNQPVRRTRSPGGYRGGAEMGMEPSYGRSSHRPSRGGSSTRMLGPAAEGDYGPFDVPLEIAGIIYIYNPPDRDKLGTGAAAEKPAEAAPPVEKPAAPAVEKPAAPAVEKPAAPPAVQPAAPPAKKPAAPPAEQP